MEDIEQKIEEIKLNENTKSITNDITEEKQQQHTNASIFSAIADFISCLSDKYGEQFHELELYQVLLDNTRIIHKEQINNHISLFRTYFEKNINCIVEKDLTKLDESIIKYSDKIYVNLKAIVDVSTEDDRKIIFEHLMVLVALLCPEEQQVLDIIKATKTTNSSSSSSPNLFETIFQQVNETISNSDEENPMALLGNLLQSDFMNNIVNSVSENLQNTNTNDMSDMMNSLQGMISTVTQNLNTNQK